MNRRTALKLAAGGFLGGGAGVLFLTQGFKTKFPPVDNHKELKFNPADFKWKYHKLNPVVSAERAYQAYNVGSCMYAITYSVISQLAEQFGEPYASFPIQMMEYGHGGVGGYGTLCGALNGGAALLGLFVADKGTRDMLTSDLFKWYEKTALPVFSPEKPLFDYTPVTSVAESTLCHASMVNWAKTADHRAGSKQRKERCRRLTADVAATLTTLLNQFSEENCVLAHINDAETQSCLDCHGSEGKLGNVDCTMDCASCHDKSIGHHLFADAHYKLMDKKE
jgi:hypothetical protein